MIAQETKCPGDRYKGIKPPTCNCRHCTRLWENNQGFHLYDNSDTLTTFTCDICYITENIREDGMEASELVFSLGWRYGNDKTYCPKCVPKSLQ